VQLVFEARAQAELDAAEVQRRAQGGDALRVGLRLARGADLHFGDQFGRTLGGGVVAAQAVDAVAEELDAHGQAGVRRVDVDDAAAPRHLAYRLHQRLEGVAQTLHAVEEAVQREPRAHAHRLRAAIEVVRRDRLLGQRLYRRHHDRRSRGGPVV